MPDDDLQKALTVLDLALPLTRDMLEQKRRSLLHTWHPHRYANLTNNPRKYMQMFKKAEATTKDIEAAYRTVLTWLSSQESLTRAPDEPACEPHQKP